MSLPSVKLGKPTKISYHLQIDIIPVNQVGDWVTKKDVIEHKSADFFISNGPVIYRAPQQGFFKGYIFAKQHTNV